MDTVIKIGEQVPDFELKDLKGNTWSLDKLRGWIVVLVFWSAECEWCERVDPELVNHLEPWKEQVRILWIASNSNETSELIRKVAAERKLPAVLQDEKHRVADMYGVQTTPHFFIMDEHGKLRYQGAWDDITFRQRVATHEFVLQCVEALRQGRELEFTQTRPYGCALVRL